MRRSLKWRLLVGTTAASALVLGCLGVVLYLALRQDLLTNFDGALRARAQALSTMVEQHDDEMRFDFDPEAMPEFVKGKHAAYFEFWQDGRPWCRSPSLAGGQLSENAPPASTRGHWTHLAKGDAGRMVVISFVPRMDDEGQNPDQKRLVKMITIAVARDTEEVDDELFDAMWIIAVLCAGAIVVSGATLVVVVNRAVRPVEEVAGQIEKVREGDLSMRVDASGIPTELVPVVDKLNGLLGRLGRAFERERGFTADVAHELRTPLAGMRATLEVCRSRPRDEAGYAGAIDKSLAMLNAMQGMVENLLLLARAESGQLTIVAREVDVAELAKECWTAFEARAAERGLRIEWNSGEGGESPEQCVARCDAGNLRIVLNNVFDNAVTYSPRDGVVEIRAVEHEQEAELSISNRGCDIAPQNIDRVFERFWRSDAARGQTGVHAGLGLSLCQRLMAVMGGSVGARCEGGVFTVRVGLRR